MNNILIDNIYSNFKARGYSVAIIDSGNERKTLIPYKVINGTVFAAALIDYEYGNEWSYEEYQNVLRSFRNHVYKDDITQVNILQVICTRRPESIENLGVEFSSYWIIDMEKRMLMVYENQPARYLDARKIIEDSVDGVEYSDKDSRSFFSQGKKTFPIFTAVIVLINIGVFTWLELTGSSTDLGFMLDHGALRYSETIYGGQFYRILTHFFLHFGFEHLFSNMVVLIVLGYHLENAISKWWYIIIYMSSGIVSGITSMWWYYYIGEDCISAGASGAIFGVIGALFALLIVNRGKFEDIGTGRMIMFLLLTLYSGYQNAEVDNVAHISGFIFGLTLMFVILAGMHIGHKRQKGK